MLVLVLAVAAIGVAAVVLLVWLLTSSRSTKA